MTYNTYPQRFQKLLQHGSDNLMRTKKFSLDYEKMGFTQDDAKLLTEIALDNNLEFFNAEDEKIAYAPPHAIMALAQLKIVEPFEAILERIEFFEEDDYYLNAALRYFTALGNQKTDTLIQYFLDKTKSHYNRMLVYESLEKTVLNYPDLTKKIEKASVEYLQRDDELFDSLNAVVIFTLIDISKAQHIELIRKVFATKPVDIFYDGDLEDIEIRLGLREKRATKRKKMFDFMDLVEEDNTEKIGRNEPCPCGSGKKYKKCCLKKG